MTKLISLGAFVAGYFGLLNPVLADIQPASGLWSGDVAYGGQSGCPAEVVQQLGGGGGQGYVNRPIQFPTPFEASVIAGDFVWIRQAENLWRTTHAEASATPMGQISIQFTHVLEILTPDQMFQKSQINVQFPPQMAATLGISGPCRVDSTVAHRRVGP